MKKIDDENYDTYTTTLKIYRSLVRKCSCTYEDYRKGNLCKHIIATSMEVIEPHYASTNEGRIKLEEKRKKLSKDVLATEETFINKMSKDVTLKNGKRKEKTIPENIEIKGVFLSTKNPSWSISR